jgi:hypothetical protein
LLDIFGNQTDIRVNIVCQLDILMSFFVTLDKFIESIYNRKFCKAEPCST